MQTIDLSKKLHKYRFYILTTILVIFMGFSYLLGYSQGVANTNNVQNITSDVSPDTNKTIRPVRKSLTGTLTQIESDKLVMISDDVELTVLINEGTKYSGLDIEVGSDVVITALQDGTIYTAEKIRVLIPELTD